jgi:hypothetical protein
MAARHISTTNPASTCGVCGRTLLRGERPETYLAGGERRLVCELCVGRAVHEGWEREGTGHGTRERARDRRRSGGRSLLGRLSRPRPAGESPAAEVDGSSEGRRRRIARTLREEPADAAVLAAPHPAPLVAVPVTAPLDVKVQYAVDAFNVSEYPRRVAGVARSLGEPTVTVRVHSPGSSLVGIVVAWELSWYRYSVDTAADVPVVAMLEQGTHLEELEERDRIGGFLANDRGELGPS